MIKQEMIEAEWVNLSLDLQYFELLERRSPGRQTALVTWGIRFRLRIRLIN